MHRFKNGWAFALASMAAVFSFSLHAAPSEKTFTTVTNAAAYPMPQNVTAALSEDEKSITLQWDGVRWPVKGFPEKIDGRDVPTNFYYVLEWRTKESGTTTWSKWRERYSSIGRYESNYGVRGAFLDRVTLTLREGAGTNYEFRVMCICNPVWRNPNGYREPYEDPDPVQDAYFSDYSEIVTASKTLDKLELTLVENANSNPLRGAPGIEINYVYDSSRKAEGEKPLYFTFKALEIPYPAPGTVPEAPAVGGKPYARRDGTPLAVKTLYRRPPNIAEQVDPANFTLTASSDIKEGQLRQMTWYADRDLKNYYHTNVTIWVQGWAQPETEGGSPRLVLDEAIGNVTIDTRKLTAGPNPEQDGVLLTWPGDARVAQYEIWRKPDGGTAYRLDTVTETSYTDTAVSAGVVYHYEVKAFDSDGNEIDSAYASGYSRLDAFSAKDQSLYFVQPQTPWNGKVDIVVRYHSARDPWGEDGIPIFKLIAEDYETGATLTVKTLTRAEDGKTLDPDGFMLADEQGLEQRLVWDAGADLGETLVERLRLTVDCVRIEPYDEGYPVKAWTGSPAKYRVNVRLDTRNPRIRKLGQGTEAYVDLDWFPGATKADLYCNGTLIHTTTGEDTRHKALDNAELNIWGTNELKVVTDTGVTWTGGIAYPAFGFTVSEGNEDGITLTWNTVDDAAVGGYQIRRRAKGSTGDFETVATVGADVTTYTDMTADETGAYEYTVVPRRIWEADIGPVPAAQRGYRSLDKIEIVNARQLYPWTTQVALDVAYTSGRDEATDGAVTYCLEAELADGTPISILREHLHLETVNGFSLDPANIPFGTPALASGTTTRLWWNAPADLGQVQVPSDVVSGIVLRLVPTLADDAPEGAVAAPAPSVKDGLTVDLRTVRPVTVGEKIPITWEWMRTDSRDKTKDYTEISFELQSGEEKYVILEPEQMTGEGEIEVTDEMWTGFHLIKREMNTDDTDDANVIKLTSEVLFQLPVKPITNVQATRGNADALTVTWDPVPYATGYRLDIATYGERGMPTTQTQEVSEGTRYVDTTAPAVGLVRYTVTAVYANGMKGATSAPVVGWRTLDKAELTNVSTRRPWNGTVDIDLTYQTVRGRYAEATGGAGNLPGKTVTVAVKTAQGETFAVRSLTLETLETGGMIRREKVTNGAFTLGANDRIIWNAPTDAPRMHEPGCTLTVTLKGDEYSNEIRFEKTFDLDTRTGVIELPFGAEDVQIPWSTRWAKPGATSLGYTDNWWKQTAVLTDVTDSANPKEILSTEAQLGEGTTTSWTPKNWGENTLTLTLSPFSGGDEPWVDTAKFKLPDFAFSVETENADGVTLKWDNLDGAKSYEIRRRKAGETDFVMVTNITDATTWTDSTVDTVVGDFEYVVVPKSATGGSLPDKPSVSGTRGAPQQVQNVVATTNDTAAVTVTWDAVPHAAYYEVKAENWDVAINRTTRTVETNATCFVDAELPQPGLGRYTVTAVYANGMKGAPSGAAVGYAVLDTMKILGVSTRWPWNGKVDLDVEYKTVRTRFRELFGRDDLPYPTNVTLVAQTADGTDITVSTLVKEPAVDRNYTVNRKAVENGTAIFSGSGWLRLVWDADADTQNNLLATNATLTLTASDDYSSLTDRCTVDLDTTKPLAIPLADEETEVALPWAARWSDEASESLNMQDGTDLELVAITKYATVTNVVDTMTMLADESGVLTKQVGYGITVFENTFSNRATTASQTYRCMFFRAPVIPVTVTRMPGMNALDIRWTGAGDCNIYQIVRRTVYADGTRSDWQNMAPVSLYGENDPGPAGTGRYIDIGVVGGMTYEYAACPMYNDPDKRVEYITAEPVVWTAGSAAINVIFDALGPYLVDGQTFTTQFVGSAYGELPTATRTGYRLVGWTLGMTNGAPEAVGGGSLLIPANHTLYANWAVDPAVAPDESAFAGVVNPDGETFTITGLVSSAMTGTKLIIPDKIDGKFVTAIAPDAFANSKSGMTEVVFPIFCTSIGDRAFYNVKSLTSITFTDVRKWDDPGTPATLSVGRYAFASCIGLRELTIGESVEDIADYAFLNCRRLAKIIILGKPNVGKQVFRSAGMDATPQGVEVLIDLALESDTDYMEALKGGIPSVTVKGDAVVSSLKTQTLSLSPGRVTMTLAVRKASRWGEVTPASVKVRHWTALTEPAETLTPTAVTDNGDGTLTVEVALPEGDSGFLQAVIGE